MFNMVKKKKKKKGDTEHLNNSDNFFGLSFGGKIKVQGLFFFFFFLNPLLCRIVAT